LGFPTRDGTFTVGQATNVLPEPSSLPPRALGGGRLVLGAGLRRRQWSRWAFSLWKRRKPKGGGSALRHRTDLLEETLKQNKDDAAARLLLARTAWHSPPLGPKDAEPVLPPADDKNPLARRTRGGLLLRLEKAVEALPVLEAALKERGDDKPTVEELLLAWAYLDTNQPDRAKPIWAKATAWLDQPPEPARVNDMAGAPTDPRYNAFDWETWHEIDVLQSARRGR
jgi:hypothetical protein